MRTQWIIFIGLLALMLPRATGQQRLKDNQNRAFTKHQPDSLQVDIFLKMARSFNDYESPGYNPDKVLFYSKQADSLAQKLQYLNGQGESYNLAAQAWAGKKMYTEARKVSKQAIEIFEKTHALWGLGDLYGTQALFTEDLQQKTALHEKALGYLRQSGDKRRIADLLAIMSEETMMLGKLGVAKDQLDESLALSKEIGLEKIQWLYSLRGVVNTQMRNYPDALKDELMAVKIAEQAGDRSFKTAEIYNFTAIIYDKMGKLDNSAEYLDKSLTIAVQNKDTGFIAQLYANMGHNLIRRKKPREALNYLLELKAKYATGLSLTSKIQVAARFLRCYTELGEYKSGQPYAEELISYSAAMKPDAYDQLPLYPELNRYLIATNQFEKAAIYVDRMKLVADKFKTPDRLTTVFYLKYKIDSARGDLRSAMANYQLYTAGKDSSYNEATAKQLNQLHVEFETEKKDRDIQLKQKNIELLTKEGFLQKVLSDQKDNEIAIRKRDLELKSKDLLSEQQQVDLLKKQQLLQQAVTDKQDRDLLIKQQDISLLTQESKLQQSVLKQERMVRNIIVGGAIMLALLLAMAYNRYRLKQRSNQQLEWQREEIKEKNISLQALVADKDKLLEEKEWLVKEVHHRVKNNLQMVMSLLNRQSSYLENNDAISAIRDSQRRMEAMSLIHQKLYESENVSAINMAAYITQLVNYLEDSFDERPVRFKLTIESIDLDVTQAVPLGLILNEAITNSIKYAFPDNKTGLVAISLKRRAGNNLELIVADNGIGFPKGFDITTSPTMGINLMEGLAHQLGGNFSVSNDGGGKVMIKFPFIESNTLNFIDTKEHAIG